ncbi:unnamed protein product, partial [Didymodactylos carnosus]
MATLIYDAYNSLTRKKTYDTETLHISQLKRCLNVFDLTILGIGSTLGTGIYILTGQVASGVAGPAVIVSFLIAAVASILAGLCYAEFGARAPRAGSAYTYTYVSVGEIMAFIIGWNMILEYVIGAASTARALSAYFDSLISYSMKHAFRAHLSIKVTGFAEYADVFAMGLCLLLTAFLVLGIKESAMLNNVFTFVNLSVVLIVIVVGLTKANFHNWHLSPQEIYNVTNHTRNAGTGGFFPFGFSGTLAGAATCFYAFVGFDLVATTGEETKNPQRAIPISICFTLLVCLLVYCGVSFAITLMVPYYLIDKDAGLPTAFAYVGLPVFKYIVGVGALAGIFTSLLGSLLPLPRVLYAIASDGLIFRFIAWIHPKRRSCGYQPVDDPLISSDYLSYKPLWQELIRPSQHHPTALTASITKILITAITVNGFILCAIQIFAGDRLLRKDAFVVFFFSLSCILELIFLIMIAVQPKNQKSLYFELSYHEAPLIPFVPIFSVLINIYLILKLQPATWIRFGLWMFV